jgi:hypothetical protein
MKLVTKVVWFQVKYQSNSIGEHIEIGKYDTIELARQRADEHKAEHPLDTTTIIKVTRQIVT